MTLRRIVFSRKGFDSRTGSIPSPILHDPTGLHDHTMLSLPVPDPEGPVTYDSLQFQGLSFGRLLTEANARDHRRNRGNRRLSAADRAHLDPDLIPELRQRQPGWRPAFGQCSGAVTHLGNWEVEAGDLFLFFGWFRRYVQVGESWRPVRAAPNIHVVFGYLRIGEVYRLSNMPAPSWATSHVAYDRLPVWARDHAQLFGEARTSDPHNTLFVAADRLGLRGAEDLPGAGAFVKFTDVLQLTAPNRSRSWWRLPSFFYDPPEAPRLSCHRNPERWIREGDCWLLRSLDQGQEFVLDVEYDPNATDWAANLILQGTGRLQ